MTGRARTPCQVALVSGSLRAGSTNTAVLRTACAMAPDAVTTTLYGGMGELPWTVGDAGTYRKPVAWINASGPAAPTGAADAHDSLRKVLGYVGARIIEDACVRIAVARDMVAPDGTIADPAIREEIASALSTLVRRGVDGRGGADLGSVPEQR